MNKQKWVAVGQHFKATIWLLKSDFNRAQLLGAIRHLDIYQVGQLEICFPYSWLSKLG